jgi:SAM-dependent methyltransferase
VNNRQTEMRTTWEKSFQEQIERQAYNTAPVEAVVRTVAYYLRAKCPEGVPEDLAFLEMGCGAGPNLVWLGRRGIRISGVDISPTALQLAHRNLTCEGLEHRIGKLLEGSVTSVPFADSHFDGIIEACVFQHLDRDDRERAFHEVRRLLKPGGVFVGYMLDRGHSTYQLKKSGELSHDPGTLMLSDGTSSFHLTDIGLAHFFQKEEFSKYLSGFSVVDPCLTTYYLPREEASRRGYDEYLQSMWTVYAVK